MKIDKELAKEIKALNGDGSRAARFETWRRVEAAKKELSSTDAARKFGECLKKHGRAVVALCVASTLYERRERLDGWGIWWATAVLDIWTNRGPSFRERAAIDDGLHPTRICEYAGPFMRAVIEEGTL